MAFSARYKGREQAIADLFAATFTDAEGAEEGALIGDLARRLMTGTPARDLRVFTAGTGERPAGAILFSRLAYGGPPRAVFVLGPVAVATERQGEGIGTRLIGHGLEALRTEGVDIALTYGDPAFYGRLGFGPVSERDIPAPYPLQHPEGWLGQSLTAAGLSPLPGPARCVPAFADPVYW